MIGSTLAHFRVTAKLGEGGMGEVYRAEDTKLGREVAIKLLPEAFVADPDRLARFEREARVLASLNHQNIAGIHEVRQDDDAHFLVMELVEGETLAERIARGPIAVDAAVGIALEIAAALEEAHEQGIVHRDLKPANVKVTPDGRVKVLDFGLAKAFDEGKGDADSAERALLTQSPTLTARMTQVGVIIGTAAYMSPEQARGLEADKRSDIWSFGVVVAEMLTGRRVFADDTVSDTLAAVLKSAPSLEALPADVPAPLRRLLERCLDKDPRQRLRDIGEARIVLCSLADGTLVEAPTQTTSEVRTTRTRALVAGLAGLVAGAALVWFSGLGARPEATEVDTTPRMFTIPADGRNLFDSQAISPDGRWIAYTADSRLWLRPIDGLEARAVAGSEGASYPFWRPDSTRLGFAARGSLWTTTVAGDRPEEIASLPTGTFRSGTWSRAGEMVVSVVTGGWSGRLWRVSDRGGEIEVYLDPAAEGALKHQTPSFLLEGDGLLYAQVLEDNESQIVLRNGDDVTTLARAEQTELLFPVGTNGHVLFLVGGTGRYERELRAGPLEPGANSAEAVRVRADAGIPSTSANGLTLLARVAEEPHQVAWVSRDGEVLERLGETMDSISEPVVSADGRYLALIGTAHGQTGVWLHDLRRGVSTRLNDLDGGGLAFARDGRSVLFTDTADKPASRVLISGDVETAGPEAAGGYAIDESPDGRWMIYYLVDPETERDLHLYSTETGESQPFRVGPDNTALAAISPDGRWVAYQGDESGRWQIYVERFPEGGDRVQVSNRGGIDPAWNPAGGELFFATDNQLMTVAIGGEDELEVGVPELLFDGASIGTHLTPPFSYYSHFFHPGPNGERFLVVLGVGQGRNEMVVAENLLASTSD